MSKEQKGNRESKKPKVVSGGTKKQKKDPRRHDSAISELFGNSRLNKEPKAKQA